VDLAWNTLETIWRPGGPGGHCIKNRGGIDGATENKREGGKRKRKQGVAMDT